MGVLVSNSVHIPESLTNTLGRRFTLALADTMADDDTYLLLYTYVEDIAERRGPYRDAHLAGIRAEQEAGRIILAGALGTPPTAGAIAFRGVSPEHIEQFTAADPYVQAGLVTAQRIARWNLV